MGTINLVRAMNENNVNLMIFASTAAVYSIDKNVKTNENDGLSPI